MIRIHKAVDPYARIQNRILCDQRLTYRARGILAYLLSKPQGWEIRFRDVVARGPEGQDAIRSAFRELSQFGYARLVLTPQGNRWILTDESPTEKPDVENHHVENHMGRNGIISNTDSTKTEVQTKDKNITPLLSESVATIKNGAQIPSNLDNPKFREAWDEYAGYRKENKKRYGDFGPIAQKRLLNTLSERPNDAVPALTECINRGWRGFSWDYLDNARRTIRNIQPKQRLNDDL